MTIVHSADQTDKSLRGGTHPYFAKSVVNRQKNNSLIGYRGVRHPKNATSLGQSQMNYFKTNITPQVSNENSESHSATSLVAYRGLIERVIDAPWNSTANRLIDMLLCEMAEGP